jgi:dTDP-glucose 4,6-dehydratase
MKGKVLVTGADGFIGSHLTEALVRSGYDVRAFVLYNSLNHWGWLESCAADVRGEFEVFCGDIRDANGVREAMKGCRIVFHLAALIGIPFSYHSPDAYVDTNIKGTLNVLQASRQLDVERIIHTSTSEVYGTALYVPIDEQHPLQGQSPYSATKIAADQLALSFVRSFNTPVIIIRPFNTYGPRQSARAVIPTIITQIAGGRKTLKLGALHPTRDFNFVSDIVEGFIAAGRASGCAGEVINLGSNYEVSIGETVSLIAEIMAVELEVATEDIRVRPAASEVERLWANNAKARELLGWSPHYGGKEGLRRGLSETIKWFTSPQNLRGYKWDIYNV